MNIEESLLLKLFIWAGYKQSIPAKEDVGDSEFETQRILSEATSVHAKRYYFGQLQLVPNEVSHQILSCALLETCAVSQFLNLI